MAKKAFLTLMPAAGLLFAGVALAQTPRPPAGPPKLQVLIITGQISAGHDWRATTAALEKELEDTGKFEVRVDQEFRGAGPETLAPYDLVVLNYAGARWGDRADAALVDFVRSGKGLVLYHFSLAAFSGWDDYEKLSGCNWRPALALGHHSAPHDFVVNIKDSSHAITNGMKASFAQKNDELYANLKCQPAAAYHVLATAYDDHALYPPDTSAVPQPTVGPGQDEPILWTQEAGKGRVFVTTLGHNVSDVVQPGFASTFTRGAEWAATGKVTIAPSAELVK